MWGPLTATLAVSVSEVAWLRWGALGGQWGGRSGFAKHKALRTERDEEKQTIEKRRRPNESERTAPR